MAVSIAGVADRVWVDIREGFTPSEQPRPALFLDRDGVVVVEVNYLSKPQDAQVQPGVSGLISEIHRRGLPVAVVTNQAGIDRGLFGWDDFHAVETEIARQLAAEGVAVDAVAACPYHPEFTKDLSPAEAAWRKPGPSMILHLAEVMNIDLGQSWIIGDRASDLESGRAAGLAGGVHVAAGHGQSKEERAKAVALASRSYRVLIAADMIEAAALIQDRLGIEIGGQKGPEPTRYGDWERGGRCTDF